MDCSSSVKYTRQDNNNPVIPPSDGDSDEDDIDIKNAKAKLKQLLKKQEKQRKDEKLRRLAEETRRVEKSLKEEGRKKEKKATRSVTSADLRSMNDVVQKVDRIMDDKKLNFKESDSSDCESESETFTYEKPRIRNDSDGEILERKKSGEDKKKKSGKESKLTSDVDFPQVWPHSKLRGHFVGKDKKYDDLTIAEFVAGYMSIVMKSKSVEKKARITHLEELMYLATYKPWKSVLNYHGACLLEIERGNLEWGDNFQLHGLQSTFFNVVGQGQNFQQRGSTSSAFEKPSTPSNYAGGNQRVWFCKAYQSGNCTFSGDHNGYMYGRTEFLRHICAKCWQAGKKQSQHSEQSDACPLSKIQL